jgi:hypothetical protein
VVIIAGDMTLVTSYQRRPDLAHRAEHGVGAHPLLFGSLRKSDVVR